MENDAVSPLKQFSRIEAAIQNILGGVDVAGFESGTRKQIELMRRNLELLRKLLKDYETEEDTRTQSELLHQAIKDLNTLRKQISAASLQDIFGGVDVAQLSAQIDQLNARLR